VSHPVWEDHLLERKTDRQLKDIRRTAVAFANSVRPGHTAVILIGEGNDGDVSGVVDPDELQRKLRRELEAIYPSIVWRQTVYQKGEKDCIRIEIEYSGDTRTSETQHGFAVDPNPLRRHQSNLQFLLVSALESSERYPNGKVS
jgi:predicted HTH transcriptional regulator